MKYCQITALSKDLLPKHQQKLYTISASALDMFNTKILQYTKRHLICRCPQIIGLLQPNVLKLKVGTSPVSAIDEVGHV
jgi:hypothetical protein